MMPLLLVLCLLSSYTGRASNLFSTELEVIARKEIVRILPRLLQESTHSFYEDCVRQSSETVKKLIRKMFHQEMQNMCIKLWQAQHVKYPNSAKRKLSPPFFGMPQAPYTVLMFTDPYCDFCHQSLDIYARYVKTHRHLKVVIYDFPIGGRDSYMATRALLAAHKRKKHNVLRKALYQKNKKDEENTHH